MRAFVTVGLDRKPFLRLLQLVDLAVERQLLSRETLVQCGHTDFCSRNLTIVKFLPFASMLEAVKKAELVITHAGVGSVLLCLQAGQQPLVVPREGDRGEHVDNHQLEFAEVMEAAGKVMAAYNKKEFFRLLEQASAWCHNLHNVREPVLEPELARTIKALIGNRFLNTL